MKAVLESCVSESALKISDQDIEDLTTILFESADADGSGSITFEEMIAEFEKHPEALDSLTIRCERRLYSHNIIVGFFIYLSVLQIG